MTVPSDIAIAQAAKLRPIPDVAAELGLGPDEILPYGRYKAKISAEAVAARRSRPGGWCWSPASTRRRPARGRAPSPSA